MKTYHSISAKYTIDLVVYAQENYGRIELSAKRSHNPEEALGDDLFRRARANREVRLGVAGRKR